MPVPLVDDIRTLRDQTLSDLDTAHDYFTDTVVAWEIVGEFVAAGNTLSLRNATTGTVTTHVELVAKSRGYVAEQLAEATFQQFIAIFEHFFFDLLRLWLAAYPRSLGAKTVEFRQILDAADKDAITRHVVNRELNEVMYERPAEWFAYLQAKVNLGCPTQDEIARIAEAKASRDVLVHGRRVASKTYEQKAGPLARYADGQQIDIPEHYHRATWELLRKVVADLSNAAIAKI